MQPKAFRARAGSGRIWALPGHSGQEDYVHHEMPAFKYNPSTIPPFSHTVRFFTSCARPLIDTEPDAEYHKAHHWAVGKDKKYFNFR